MFPELDDLTYSPRPSGTQLSQIQSRGDALRRRHRIAYAAVPVLLAAIVAAVAVLPADHAAPKPQPAGGPHELRSPVVLPTEPALSIVEQPLVEGADLAVITDIAPGKAVMDRLFVVSGQAVRVLPAVDASTPAISPDGRFVVFRSHSASLSRLELLDVETGTRTRLEENRDAPSGLRNSGSQLWWSANGSILADGYTHVSPARSATEPRVRIWSIGEDGAVAGPLAEGPVPGDLLGLAPSGESVLALGDQTVLSSPTTDIDFTSTGIPARPSQVTATGLNKGAEAVDVDGGGISPDGQLAGAFVTMAIGGANGATTRWAWVLNLASEHWETWWMLTPEQGLPAGWTGDLLARLDVGERPDKSAVILPADDRAPVEKRAVLQFEPATAQVRSVSLATGRVYYAAP